MHTVAIYWHKKLFMLLVAQWTTKKIVNFLIKLKRGF